MYVIGTELVALGVAPGRVTVAADVAWLLPQVGADFGEQTLRLHGLSGHPLVGVNVNAEHALVAREPKLFQKLAAVLDTLIEAHGARVVFLCNEVREGETYDKAAAALVAVAHAPPACGSRPSERVLGTAADDVDHRVMRFDHQHALSLLPLFCDSRRSVPGTQTIRQGDGSLRGPRLAVWCRARIDQRRRARRTWGSPAQRWIRPTAWFGRSGRRHERAGPTKPGRSGRHACLRRYGRSPTIAAGSA